MCITRIPERGEGRVEAIFEDNGQTDKKHQATDLIITVNPR